MSFESIIAIVAVLGSILSILLDPRVGGLFKSIFASRKKDNDLAAKVQSGEVTEVSPKDFHKLKGQLERRDRDLKEFKEKTYPFNEKLGTDPTLSLLQARQRIRDDETRLHGNASRNLGLGIFITLIAIAWLSLSLTSIDSLSTNSNGTDLKLSLIISKIVPRAALGILVQFVGFFFLRLYVSNEKDAAVARNEITNLDLRLSAIVIAKNGDDEQKMEVVKALTKEERNFILKKGEVSISHQNRNEFPDLSSIIESVTLKTGAASGKPKK